MFISMGIESADVSRETGTWKITNEYYFHDCFSSLSPNFPSVNNISKARGSLSFTISVKAVEMCTPLSSSSRSQQTPKSETALPSGTSCDGWWKYSGSLPNVVPIRHRCSYWALEMGLVWLNFKFYLVLVGFNINNHTRLLVILLESVSAGERPKRGNGIQLKP